MNSKHRTRTTTQIDLALLYVVSSKVIVYRRFRDFLNELWTSVNEPLEVCIAIQNQAKTKTQTNLQTNP